MIPSLLMLRSLSLCLSLSLLSLLMAQKAATDFLLFVISFEILFHLNARSQRVSKSWGDGQQKVKIRFWFYDSCWEFTLCVCVNVISQVISQILSIPSNCTGCLSSTQQEMLCGRLAGYCTAPSLSHTKNTHKHTELHVQLTQYY